MCGKSIVVITPRNFMMWTLCLLFAWFWSIPVLQFGLRRSLFIVFVGWLLSFLIARKLTKGTVDPSDAESGVTHPELEGHELARADGGTAFQFSLYFFTMSSAIVAVTAALQSLYVVAICFVVAMLVALPATPLKSKKLRICLLLIMIIMGNYIATHGIPGHI